MAYKSFGVLIEPKSSFITPLQADTIFGSLMWAFRYAYGESELVDLLKSFFDKPPFLISNAIPYGFFPRPLIPLEKPKEASDKDLFAELKKTRKIKYIPQDKFEVLINSLSSSMLIEILLELASLDLEDKLMPKTDVVQKNVINRLNFTTVKGGLFEQEEVYFGNMKQIIYVKFNKDQKNISEDSLKDLFNKVSLFGYGKKKSTGKGAFEISFIDDVVLPEASNSNGFISLSNFVPAKDDPINGYYDTLVKFGKLGGDFASSQGGPWKKPLLMLKEGSVFGCDAKPLKDFYGRMISDIYPHSPLKEKVKHYAYAFPLGVNIR